MSQELQIEIDDGQPESPEAPEQEAPEHEMPEAAELAEAPDPEKPEIPPLTPEQQEAVNRNIKNRLQKHRETEERLAKEEQARKAAEAKLQELTAPIRPDIPPLPDPYDDDFEAKVSQRDAVIAQAAQYDATQRFLDEQRQIAQQREAEAKNQAFASKVDSYRERAEKMGISSAELMVAGNTVATFGMSEDLAEYIIDDEDGPAITKFLADHPDEAEKVSTMSLGRAAVYIDKKITPYAKTGKKEEVPPPANRIEGGKGLPEGERGPDGAMFE